MHAWKHCQLKEGVLPLGGWLQWWPLGCLLLLSSWPALRVCPSKASTPVQCAVALACSCAHTCLLRFAALLRASTSAINALQSCKEKNEQGPHWLW